MVIQGQKQGEDLFRVVLFENVVDAIDTIDSRPGTHIAVRNFPCPDWHHGIYMGRNNKRTVIHVRDGKVKAVRLAEFGGHPDNQCAEIVYHEAYALPLETSIQLALDSLERHEQEDFSMKCRTKQTQFREFDKLTQYLKNVAFLEPRLENNLRSDSFCL